VAQRSTCAAERSLLGLLTIEILVEGHHLRVMDFGRREKQAQIIGAAEFGRRKHKKESPCDRRTTNLRTAILETDAKKANLTRTRRQVGLGCLVQPQGLKL
jgi:hypothetical protein